jgi:DNA-binding Lrp family transcriptional regulator
VLDALDHRIVGALHVAPRATWDDLSEVLDVDASTISRRFTKLKTQNVLRVVGEVDWRLFSNTLPVHLRITPAGTPPEELLQRLEALPEVQHLALTSGNHPIFATIHAATESQTVRALGAVYGVDGVGGVTTEPVLTFAAKGSGWDPLVLNDSEREKCLEIARSSDGVPASAEAPNGLRLLPDSTEKEALLLLQQDGRLAASHLARSLGVANSTALRMVRKAMDEGWFKARIEIDGTYLGYSTPFLLRVSTSPASAAEVSRRLAAHPSTRLLTQVAGEHQLLCTGLAKNRSHLSRVLNEDLGAIPGIRNVDVNLILFESRRYWMQRGTDQKMGRFSPPPLL